MSNYERLPSLLLFRFHFLLFYLKQERQASFQVKETAVDPTVSAVLFLCIFPLLSIFRKKRFAVEVIEVIVSKTTNPNNKSDQ